MSSRLTREPVNMLWVGERLSALEQLACVSFLDHGHPLNLWSYHPIVGVPEGVRSCDARELIPESAVFRYGPEAGLGEGSLAAFANLFRYRLLYERGGWWADSDVVCLRPLLAEAPHCFAWEDAELCNVALMRAPRGSALMKRMLEEGTVRARGKLKWGETGPLLFTRVLREENLLGLALPPQTYYPIHYGESLALFGPDHDGQIWRRLEGPTAVHFWHENLRRAQIDKDGFFDPTSPFERLIARHRIERAAPAPRVLAGRDRKAAERPAQPPLLSVCIVTKNSAAYLEPLLQTARSFADELFIAVDAKSTDDTARVAAQYADTLLEVEPEGHAETVLPWLLRRCQGEWILRLDDDELPSQALVDSLPALMADRRYTHYRIPCRWVAPTPEPRFLAQAPWWPDRHVRLFRKDCFLPQSSPGLHSSARIYGTGGLVRRGSTYHLDFVFHDEATRLAKMGSYARLAPGNFLGGYYFPDLDSVSLAAFPDDDLPARPGPPLPRMAAASPSRTRPAPAPPAAKDLRDEDYRSAALCCSQFPSTAQKGSVFEVELELTNHSPQPWGPGAVAVRVSYHWFEGEALVQWDGLRSDLSTLLAPGETVLLPVQVQAPPQVGTHRLQWDLVIESVTWFSHHGFRAAGQELRVTDWRPLDIGQTGSARPGQLVSRSIGAAAGREPVAVLVGLDVPSLNFVGRVLDRHSSWELVAAGPSRAELEPVAWQARRARTRRRWGMLAPGAWSNMVELQDHLRDACFVHVVRDGRRVAAPPAREAAEAAGWWSSGVEQARRASFALGRYLELRIEDLMEKPEAVTRELCGFLALPWEPGLLLAQAELARSSPELSSAAAFVWDPETYAQVAGAVLLMLGYPL